MINRKILVALLSIAVALALVGIATYALFNDTASSTGNQFTAGTMNLTVNGAEQLTQLNVANIVPGWTRAETYVLHNQGDVQGRGQFALKNLVDAGQLSDKMNVAIDEDGAEAYNGTLRDLAANPADLDILTGGADSTVTVTFSVDPSVGNEIRNNTATFDLAFSLTSEPMR